MPRPRQSAEEQNRIRRRIVVAAREFCDREGVEALSMRALAAQVGMSAAALYGYFSDKDDLLAALWRDALLSLETRLEAISQDEADPVAALRTLASAYADYAIENPIPFRLLFALSMARPDRTFDDDNFSPAYVLVRERMVEAMEQGRLRRQDADVAVQVLWAAIHGVFSLHAGCADFPLSEPRLLVGRAIDAVLDGFAAERRA
jgi:AcrR family transcriptional regulator